MEDYKTEDIPLDILRNAKIPRYLFLISLILGTLLLLAFLFTKSEGLIGIGIAYVGIAFLANGITFIGMVVYACQNRKYRSYIFWQTPILFLNIPIAFVYMNIVIHTH